MDVEKALRDLYKEKEQLDAAIATLEAQLRMMSQPAARGRRGRKSMSPEERLKVSRRMSQYWEARRAQMRALEDPPAPTPPAPAVEGLEQNHESGV